MSTLTSPGESFTTQPLLTAVEALQRLALKGLLSTSTWKSVYMESMAKNTLLSDSETTTDVMEIQLSYAAPS